MGFKAIDWYCQPEANGVWAKAVSAFGTYTPCAMDSMVICISHLVLLGLCCYRVWMIKKNLKARRFRLRSNYYNYLLGLLAGYSTAEPLLRLVMGLSLFNPCGRTGFAPFEVLLDFWDPLWLDRKVETLELYEERKKHQARGRKSISYSFRVRVRVLEVDVVGLFLSLCQFNL